MVESLLEILTKWRSQTFCKPVDVHFVANAIGESISSISILNQLGRYDSDLGSLLHKTGERDSLLLSKTFSLSETNTESDDSVVLLKKGYYLKTV